MKQNNSKILYTGFKKVGKNGTSCSDVLLDKVDKNKTFLFTNNFDVIEEEIKSILKEDYDKIIMFGQKPLINNLRIEKRAVVENNNLFTNFSLDNLELMFKEYDISYKFSENPGNSYCNYAYFQMLKRINEQNLKTEVVFIHIPYIDRFKEINKVINLLNNN